MLLTILLFPFRMLGRLTLGSIRLSVRVSLGALRTGGGALRAAVLMPMAFTLVHVGVGVLTGQTDVPSRVLVAASVGAALGAVYGFHRARTRPKALPTPPALRPGFGRRLLRVGRTAALALVV